MSDIREKSPDGSIQRRLKCGLMGRVVDVKRAREWDIGKVGRKVGKRVEDKPEG